jgi:hypothetical protein
VASTSLTPVPSEQTGDTCPNCSAPLVGDQRYCLACGHPCSPVRLAFLDVLQSEHQPRAGRGWGPEGMTGAGAPVGYVPLLEPSGAPGWLRRYSGLFGLLSVLLMAMIIGLLVGHWVSQSKAPGQQVLKVEGLGTVPAAATTTSPTSTTPAASKSNAKAEAEEAKEAAQETRAEKAPPPKPVKVSSSGLKKLSSSTGKQHEEEVNKLGDQPIETGGGSSSTSAPASKESGKSIGGGSKVETIE